eukprot:TRINITY_DN168_c0_g1_i1.p1 TRINITY_DN168_c0_g1~~TRINITY_DN168_c0_g1_i1.p1  ORF type:complete len:176 (-),score=90.08 TRINITY_DN168_c0_g1_i1:152-679(-)
MPKSDKQNAKQAAKQTAKQAAKQTAKKTVKQTAKKTVKKSLKPKIKRHQRPKVQRFFNKLKQRKVKTSFEATINLHKLIHKIQFKKRAPRAMKEIRKFAAQFMKNDDVRIDTKVNKQVWSQGIKGVPFRVRVRLTKKTEKSEEQNTPNKVYILVQLVEVKNFKGLKTRRVKPEQN